MNRGFETQLLESLSHVNRHRAWWEEYQVSTLNLAILIIGFISLAIAYTLNGIPLETLAETFGASRGVIETPPGAESAAEALTKLPRALARFVDG